MNKIVRYLAISLSSTVLVFGTVLTAQAAEFIAPTEESGNVTVSADSEHRNLYVAGGSVLVNGKTNGDLYTAGGNITVEGDVEQDLVIAGGNLYLNGAIGGDLRAAGGSIIINSAIAGDVVVFGGAISITEKASIGGDLIVNGGDVQVNGAVSGRLTINAETTSINSAVSGPIAVTAQKVSVGSKAVFGENAKYRSPNEATVQEGAQVGSLQYEKLEGKNKSGGAAAVGTIISVGFIIKLLAMIAVALVLNKLFPRKSDELIRHVESHTWSNLGIGFLGIIVAPVIAVVLLFTLIGFYASMLILALWFAWSLVGALVGMVFVGAWINKRLSKKSEINVDWQSIVIGIVVTAILGMIPVLGWLFVLLVVLAGFGTILRHVAAVIRSQQQTTTVVENN